MLSHALCTTVPRLLEPTAACAKLTTGAFDESPLMTPSPATAAVRVRRAELSDLDDLVALEHATFDSDRVSRAQFRRHLDSDSARVLVASANHRRFLGTAMVFFRKGSRVARLYSIASLPESRGKGVGTALIEAAETAARQRRCHALRLEVRTDNHNGYHRFGPVVTGFYEDGSDAFRYEKILE
jgi:ribosomal-protein-alanine N-acetyltransferase